MAKVRRGDVVQWWGGAQCCRPVLLVGTVKSVEVSGRRARVLVEGKPGAVVVEVERLEVLDSIPARR